MLDNIKIEIKKHFKNSSFSGILFYSGSFSRNEISVIDSVLLSDMELFYVFSEKKDFSNLKIVINKLEFLLKNNYSGIPQNFEIEIEGIHFKELEILKYKLPVHQYEALKNNDIIFDNLNKSSLFLDLKVDISSVYDILLHRILNQISLSFNFDKNKINNVFYNRSFKNISDFLTYNYLYFYNHDKNWISKKSERNIVLNQSEKLKFLNHSDFNLNTIDYSRDDSFNLWKNIFIHWINHYNQNNYELLYSSVNNKSSIAKIYNYLIQILIRLFYKKPLSIRELLNIYERILFDSNSFYEFNIEIVKRLKLYGYSKYTYIFLNGCYFTYWLRHYKYYKSLK